MAIMSEIMNFQRLSINNRIEFGKSESDSHNFNTYISKWYAQIGPQMAHLCGTIKINFASFFVDFGSGSLSPNDDPEDMRGTPHIATLIKLIPDML